MHSGKSTLIAEQVMPVAGTLWDGDRLLVWGSESLLSFHITEAGEAILDASRRTGLSVYAVSAGTLLAVEFGAIHPAWRALDPRTLLEVAPPRDMGLLHDEPIQITLVDATKVVVGRAGGWWAVRGAAEMVGTISLPSGAQLIGGCGSSGGASLTEWYWSAKGELGSVELRLPPE